LSLRIPSDFLFDVNGFQRVKLYYNPIAGKKSIVSNFKHGIFLALGMLAM